MKVILNQTVPKVGKQGTVVTVADGFARNYLFPRGLAIVAEKKQVAALERRNAAVAAKTAGQKSDAETQAERLDGKTIRIEGKVGQGRRLFGAVTAQDIADAIQAQLGEAIDRKKIALIEPIKQLGRHDIELDLHREVHAVVHLVVFDPNAPEEEEAKAEAMPEGEEADAEATADEAAEAEGSPGS
jgi:large subunit ribosomal protein L9